MMLPSEILSLLLLFAVGVIAGFINIMAGGGSTLSLPTLIFLGLDGALANGTNRVAVFIQNISAIFSFHQEKLYHFKSVLTVSLWTLPGSVLGAFFAIKINDSLFQKILAIVIIAVVISVIIPQKKPVAGNKNNKSWFIYPALFGIGFYGGFIQAGVGFLIMAAFLHIKKFDLVQVNMYKVFIVFIYTLPALIIFALSGKINVPYALALAAGNATGGWWSAKLAIKKGEKIIRFILFVAVAIIAFKLIRQ